MGTKAKQPQPQQADTKSDDDIPACQSCRRKKARCSRQQPCSQCVRFNATCIYDDKRLKPGLRAGAVDTLSRRIETLENMFLGQEIIWKQMWETLHPQSKFPGIVIDTPNGLDSSAEPDSICVRQESLRRSLLQITAATHEDEVDEMPQMKRRRIDLSPGRTSGGHDTSAGDVIESEAMGQLVEFYFDNFHHWIPILHVRRFRHQIQCTEGRRSVIYILYAIIAACIRFVHTPRLADEGSKAQIAEDCRQKVVLCSMESFSVENLQALVIVAFDTIARGRGPSSWSIVGSMARTVEQLQLSIEEDNVHDRGRPGETLIRRMAFLKPSSCWREVEERRRVFWTVFLMDRFCSVSTGWNVSLTTADVKRRLPCEGSLWQRETEVRAPYFGVSDAKGTAQHRSLLLDRPLDTDPAEEDSIGGFAYCIEATESLALVSNFFVQQPLDVRNVQETQVWLMRFKELDLRLVQWKLFLPSKWREASTLNADGIMDSNLTLAHITHNTVVILLHQAIAYPPHHWKSSPVKLPSSSSAETCIEASSEICTLGQQFLLYSPMLTNPQFSFCLFIAGRMLLTHARYYAIPVSPALDTLISSLFEISARWAGPRDTTGPDKGNLATVFAKRLVQARDNISPTTTKGNLDIRQTVYSETTEDGIPMTDNRGLSVDPSPHQLPSSASAPAMTHFAQVGVHADKHFTEFPETNSESSLTLAFPPLPLSFHQDFAAFADPNPDPDTFSLSVPAAPDHARTATTGPAWNGNPSEFDPQRMGSFSTRSTGSGDGPSPGQRVSRFEAGAQGSGSIV